MVTQSTLARTPDALFKPLGANAVERPPYAARIAGALPAELRGTLYRNGPGLFSRGGRSKANALDGDGLVQRLAIADGKASYSRRFVRTEKFNAEAEAGRFLYPTWTTRAPHLLANVEQQIKSRPALLCTRSTGSCWRSTKCRPPMSSIPARLKLRVGNLGPARFRQQSAGARQTLECQRGLAVRIDPHGGEKVCKSTLSASVATAAAFQLRRRTRRG